MGVAQGLQARKIIVGIIEKSGLNTLRASNIPKDAEDHGYIKAKITVGLIRSVQCGQFSRRSKGLLGAQ